MILRKIFASRTPPRATHRAHTQAGARLDPLIRVIYAFPLYWVASRLPELTPLLDPAEPELLWPVAWLRWVGADTGAAMIFGGSLLAFTAAAALPESRALRIAAFVGLLELLALKYSFGKIHHLMHGWLFVTFILMFLPAGWSRAEGPGLARRRRQHALLVFSAAQTAVCLTYALAGFGKLLGTAYQAARGEPTPLHPSALARHIADRLLQTHTDSVLGAWMIEHAPLLWPLMLATLYLQTCALWAAFRPRLHRLWGIGLMGFHVVTMLSMTIDFTPNILLVGVLLLASPTAPRALDLRGIVFDLPLFGSLASRVGGQSSLAARASCIARNKNSNASKA